MGGQIDCPLFLSMKLKSWISLGALALFAAIPFLPPARFYFLEDGFLHLFRLWEFDRVLRQGIFYPRWAPDFASGYGYPVFNFYPPFAYYLAESFHLLGLAIPGAIIASFFAAILVAIAGAYAMGREFFADSPARHTHGILTAVAYVFFPYFLLDIYSRGALAEVFAAAFLPWVVWSLRRLLVRRTLAALIIAGLFAALLLLSHNLIAFLSAPFLGAYVVWELFQQPGHVRRRAIICAIGAAMLGAMLSAIYWLPSIAELSLVLGSRDSQQIRSIFEFTFLEWQNLFQLQIPYVYGEQPYPLSILPMVLGTLVLALMQFRARGLGFLFGVFALVAMLLLVSWSKSIWLSVPLLKTVFFPWRLEVIIGLSIAIVIGSLPMLLNSSHWRLAVVVFIAAALIWNGLGALNVHGLDNPRDELTLAQTARFEANTRSFGFGWISEYLPLTVKSLPDALPVSPNTSVPKIEMLDCNAARCVLDIAVEKTTPITFRQFYFPGWRTTIDNQPVASYPSTPMGLIAQDVPPGKHRLVLEWGDTPARQIGTLISGIGVTALLILCAIVFRRREESKSLVILLVVIGFSLLPSMVLASTTRPPVLQSLQSDVSPELRAIGLSMDNAPFQNSMWQIRAPRTIDVKIFWQVKQSVQDKPLAWRVVDDAGSIFAQREQLARFGTGKPGAWIPNEIVEDHYDLWLGEQIPSGKYTLQVAFPADSKFVAVSSLQIESSNQSANVPAIPHRIDALVGDDIHLLGFDAPLLANPGRVLPVTLFWQIDRDVHEDFTGFVQLLDADGRMAAQHDELTDNGFNPTMLWHAGRIIEDKRNLVLPPNLSPGKYRLVAGLYRFETLERLPVKTGNAIDDVIDLGWVKVPVNPPTQSPSHRLDVALGPSIRLEGYDLVAPQAGQPLRMQLYWQAIASMNGDAQVFVHIVDVNGNVVAQHDGAPVSGKYPTSLWSPGEKIADPYLVPLDLPPGIYKIRVGMYDGSSGERFVITQSNGDELPNRQIEIGQVELTAR